MNNFLVRSSALFVNIKNDRESVKKYLKECICNPQVLILIFLLAILSCLVTARYKDSRVEKAMMQSINVPAEEMLDALALSSERSLATTNDIYKEEAEYIAKVLYGTAANNSSKGKELVTWCILNRVENDLYPDTIQEVCQQKDQWMGYSDSNPIMRDLYDIAYKIVSDWHNGSYRTVSPDYIYLSWSPKSIVLRTEFKDSKSCRYLYE